MSYLRSRLSTAAVVTSVLVVSISSPHASNAPATPRHLQVTGYAVDSTSPATIDAQAPALTTVGVDGIDVAQAGNAVTMPSPGALRLLATAHADGLRAELLVSNFEGIDASTAVATRLLTSDTRRARVAAALARLVRKQGWNGITVDLEALAARDAQGLVGFVARLRELLAPRFQVAVDVSATQSLAEYSRSGYHLGSLGRVADVVLMAYNEDGPWSGPGPIGGLPWQRAAVAAARHAVPGERLILGVAAYGYTWPPGARVHEGISVSDAQARRLAAASDRRPHWVASQGEWTVRLRNGTVLWWSDDRSYALRRRMASRDGLAGLAVWQLSSSDLLPRP